MPLRRQWRGVQGAGQQQRIRRAPCARPAGTRWLTGMRCLCASLPHTTPSLLRPDLGAASSCVDACWHRRARCGSSFAKAMVDHAHSLGVKMGFYLNQDLDPCVGARSACHTKRALPFVLPCTWGQQVAVCVCFAARTLHAPMPCHGRGRGRGQAQVLPTPKKLTPRRRLFGTGWCRSYA